MSHNDEIANVITKNKEVIVAGPYPLSSHLEKGMPCDGRLPKLLSMYDTKRRDIEFT